MAIINPWIFLSNRGLKRFKRSQCGCYFYDNNNADLYRSWLGVFNKLFQFVQWEDSAPTLIKDVLENCEVVEDDL